MRIKQSLPPKERWTRVFILSVSLLFMAFMVKQINCYLWESLSRTVYASLFPVLTAFFLYFGGLSLGTEVKLLFAYWAWYLISRALNGSTAFTEEYVAWMNCGMFFALGSLGLMVNAAQRRKLLNWVGGAVCGYHTVLALVAIFCALKGLCIINPITEGFICAMHDFSFPRLIVMDSSPNIGSAWFFAVFFLLIYFLLGCRKKLWRIPIVLAAAANYFALTLTYCRNVKICFSVSTAMLVMLLALRYLPLKKTWQKAAAVILAAVLFIPLTYKSFDGAEHILQNAYKSMNTAQTEALHQPAPTPEAEVTPETSEEPEAEETSQAPADDPAEDGAEAGSENMVFNDPRDLGKSFATLSDRTQIYESAFVTLKQEPIRLLRGCYWKDIMSVAQPILELHNVHFHNFLLQTLVHTGLMGFLLALSYCVLLVIRMLRYFFSEDPSARFSEKLLTLPLTGLLIYNMLEPQLFNYADFSVLYFFFIAGIFLGDSYELHPPKRREK